MAKVLAFALAIAALGSTTAAHAQFGSGQPPSTNRAPYDDAVRCFIANAIASGDRQRAGDPAKAAYYERMAKKAHGTAYVLGDVLGFKRDQITRDFERAEREETPAMRRDQAYFYRIVGRCKALELM